MPRAVKMMIGKILIQGTLLFITQMMAPTAIRMRVMITMTQRSQGRCLCPLPCPCGLLGGYICCCCTMATYPSALNGSSGFYGIIA